MKKRFITGNEDLDIALFEEKRLTAYFYERMSGKYPWKDGEKASVTSKMDSVAAEINTLMREETASWFAGFSQ